MLDIIDADSPQVLLTSANFCSFFSGRAFRRNVTLKCFAQII
jgi:hypothetical protein